MSPDASSSDADATVPLTEAEQDEINNRVVSGDAAREDSAGDVELARLGSYVLLEVEEDQHIEKHADDEAADARYEELRAEHIEPAGD